MHSGLHTSTFTFNHTRALMHFSRNRIISSRVMIVGISLRYAWYLRAPRMRLIVGEAIEMGGGVGFVG